METKAFKIKNIIYQKDGFVIFGTDCKNKLKGSFFGSPAGAIGSKITFNGDFIEHKQYGRSFEFISYQEEVANIFYFLANVVKGIGSKLAKLIVDKFGDDVSYIIENHPERLLEIQGIKQKKLDTIVSSWEKYMFVQQLSLLLSPHGVSNNTILKIYEEWGADAHDRINSNPYSLSGIKGIGFKKADEIAIKIGANYEDASRIMACVLFSFGKLISDNGHTAVSLISVRKNFFDEIKIDGVEYLPSDEDFNKAVEALLQTMDLISYGDDRFSTKEADKMERFIYETLSEAGKKHNGESLHDDIETYLTEADIALGDKQKEAIRMINGNPKVAIISGYAGAGKTTASKYALGLFRGKYENEDIVCCALSGVAANRIKLQSGFRSVTIHSLLGVKGGSFEYNTNNKLRAKVILLDEASMVDNIMFFHLLSAIDFSTTSLVMLGDSAQLPPVGPGDIFSDCIKHDIVQNVMLDKIYRQDETQAIAMIANMVREGKRPALDRKYKDFFFIERSIEGYWDKKKNLDEKAFDLLKKNNTDEILKVIIASAKKIAPRIDEIEVLAEKLFFFQVLSPVKEGPLGVKRLNTELQNALNPILDGQGVIRHKEMDFREGDKVIHLHNKMVKTLKLDEFDQFLRFFDEDLFVEQKVYNGQIGHIKMINMDDKNIYVEYPLDGFIACYDEVDLLKGDIGLAYAMSIHKSQGSEFKNVVMPMSTSHYAMLNQKLIYTAISRAKDMLGMIGDPMAIDAACRITSSSERKTITQMLSKQKPANLFEVAIKEDATSRLFLSQTESLPNLRIG